MSFTLPSFAKINLYLEVLGKREDGFHEIFTVLQTVSLCDHLTFEPIDGGLELSCNVADLATDDENLIIRAANALVSRSNIRQGARITLQKQIPVGGGLGGGSSNAATALIGLSKLWRLDVSVPDLEMIGTGLGSDTPFFLHGGTAVASGRGDEIEQMGYFDAKYLIIVSPEVHVSTARAYQDLSVLNLTNNASNRILNVSRAADLLNGELRNDFEKTVFAAVPEIRRAKEKLITLGAINALMSGSGASVFGIFDNEETRQTAMKALGEETDWRSFAVAAVSRFEYRKRLGF